MNRYYTGIGSRKNVPPEIAALMPLISATLESKGWTLRSGGAEGSDSYFAKGVKTKADIWLPWPSFNRELQAAKPDFRYRLVHNDPEAWDSIKFHPNAANLTSVVKLMMARNFRQCIGLGEPNSSFVVCYTENGEVKGGTGQALRIAEFYNIPIYNLGDEETFQRLTNWVNK